MSSSIDDQEEYDPVANLHMQPAKGILKSAKSIDDAGQDVNHQTASTTDTSATGMTRSESKSHKIPHFDEMNIIATYHPADKDYGHMKIEEPKTPYAPNDIIDEEVEVEATAAGIDPGTLAQRLNESKVPSSQPSRLRSDRLERRSIDEGSEGSVDSEHRKQFESHRKQHYNEFEIVRLRKKEIEDELRALEQEENSAPASNGSAEEANSSARLSTPRSSVDSIKPILVHHSKDSSTSSGHHHHHHVHVEDGHEEEQNLTPEERERKKQFELKRKKHYNEFRAARMADGQDDEEETTG